MPPSSFYPTHLSPRLSFQWYYVDKYLDTLRTVREPSILNIGSANDPLGFGELAHHFDIDDWSYVHKRFTQGDAHHLPFGDRSWGLVVLGDILEHSPDPVQMVREACRVADRYLALTIFEEWRLPGPGMWIEEGQQLADKVAQADGYKDRMAHQLKFDPNYKGADDNEVPHLIHVNQFTDDMIAGIVGFIVANGFVPLDTSRTFEVNHEGHEIYNWLIAFERSQ